MTLFRMAKATKMDNTIDDGFGNVWELCDRPNCGLEIVRPGKTQCWCDYKGGAYYKDQSGGIHDAE